MSGQGNIDTLIEQGYEVRPSSYLRQGWQLFKQNLGGFIGFTVLFILVNLLLGLLPVVGPLMAAFLSVGFSAGYYIVAFKLLKQEPTEFNDFFRGFDRYGMLLLATIVMGIFLIIGIILLILPGIYLSVSYLFVVPFILDRRMGFWEAMETSRRVITREWMSVFLFLLLAGLISIAIAIPFMILTLTGDWVRAADPQSVRDMIRLVGSLVSLALSPFFICSYAVAYVNIVGFAPSSETIY